MLSIVACAACGMDPASDTMLVQAAIAGAMTVPWLLRDHAFRLVRRVRKMPEPDADKSCPLPAEGDEA